MIDNNSNNMVTFDAESIDTIDDVCREVISRRLGKSGPQVIERVLTVVLECIREAQQRGMLDKRNDRDNNAAIALLDLIGHADNPKLMVRCLRFVFNLESSSQAEIAEEFGLTRAAVSRICVSLTDRLGIAPSRGMRTLQAREAYRERAREHPHQRRVRSFAFQALLNQHKAN